MATCCVEEPEEWDGGHKAAEMIFLWRAQTEELSHLGIAQSREATLPHQKETVEVVQPADPLAPPDEVFQGGPLGKTEPELLCLDCTPDLAGRLDWCQTIEVGVNGGLKPYSKY